MEMTVEKSVTFTHKTTGETETFQVGEKVFVKPDKKYPNTRCRVTPANRIGVTIGLPYFKLAKMVYEVEAPTMEELQEWVYDSVCNSINGETVEPDGYDEEGFPSWLLALGMI